MNNKVASLERVSKIYGKDDLIVKALDNVDLDIYKGDYLAVMGASGSGKSTAMNILGCLDRPSKGRYKLNGNAVEKEVSVRMLLSDFIRHELGLTGTHVGCEHGICGACTVIINGKSSRSCTLLAVQADGIDLRTIESVANKDGSLHPIQEAFHEC